MTTRGPLDQVLAIAGGCALFAAMTVDVLAVLGRHLGWPLLGSIEIVQALVLIAGVCALLAATLARLHARVHLLLERLPAPAHAALRRLNDGAAALFFALLAVGSAWLMWDLWAQYEHSELQHVPYRPLRILTTLACIAIAGAFLRQALARERR